jgi:hypothetical protein
VIATERHALVDFRRASIPLGEHEEGFIDHRQQNAVDDETGPTLDSYRRLGPRAQQLRGCFGVIEPGAVVADRLDIVGIQQLRLQHRKRGAHGLAPQRKSTVGLAGCGSRGIYAASLSRLRPPGPKAMT